MDLYKIITLNIKLTGWVYRNFLIFVLYNNIIYHSMFATHAQMLSRGLAVAVAISTQNSLHYS